MVGPRLVVDRVSRAFGPTHALSAVSLSVAPGEVHALLGENGAGKSTLMSILAGADRADSGVLSLDGVRFSPKTPAEARQAGVQIVQQEAALCAHLSVAENLFLGSEPAWLGVVQCAKLVRLSEAALSRVMSASNPISPRQLVSELSPSQRQLVAIGRALAQPNCRLLILDEPTASLSQAEVSALFGALGSVKAAGVSVIYISHVLEEVEQIADSYTVLRDGSNVASGRMADTSPLELVTKMAGRVLEEVYEHPERLAGEVALSVNGLSGVRLPKGASLELRRGEVLGIAGLLGAGRTELLRAIFGLNRVKTGEIRVAAWSGGKALSARSAAGPSAKARLAQGLGLLSEDRKLEGVSQRLSIAENITLSSLERFGSFGLVSSKRQHTATAAWITRLGIVCQGPSQRAQELSGGNQQKLALARLLQHDVDVLLLDEPTRGIDVRSRGEIYRLMNSATREGKAILMVSSYLPELLGVCDRIQVMRRGVLGAPKRAAGLTEREVLQEAML